jgi:protein KIBRA
LELDLQAQHTRLQTLQDELARLRELKSRLETARAQGDQELAAWVLEDQQFQNLVAQVSLEFQHQNQHIPTIHVVWSHH